jgi:hypothetical protein
MGHYYYYYYYYYKEATRKGKFTVCIYRLNLFYNKRAAMKF